MPYSEDAPKVTPPATVVHLTQAKCNVLRSVEDEDISIAGERVGRVPRAGLDESRPEEPTRGAAIDITSVGCATASRTTNVVHRPLPSHAEAVLLNQGEALAARREAEARPACTQ